MVISINVWTSLGLLYNRLLLLLSKVGSARLRESDVHLVSPKTPAPQYQPMDRKKRKGENSEVCRVGCVLFIKPWHHTPHISELKYLRTTHGTFPRFLEIDKTAGAYSLQIYDYLSQIQRETNAFLLIVRHNIEGPPFSGWQ